MWRTSATSCSCRAGSRRNRWSTSPGRLVKTPCLDCPKFAFRARRPPIRTVISGAVSVSSCARSTSSSCGASSCPVAGGSCGIRPRSAPARRTNATSVCSCDASVRPGEKGTFTSWPAFFAAASTAAQPPRTIRSASETFFPPDCELLNSFWIASSVRKNLRQFGRLVDLPILLRREANARPVGPAALVAAAER